MEYRRRLNIPLLAVVLFLPSKFCHAQPKIEFGPLTDLRTADGRMSFGTIVSADVVSWSAPDAKDLLIARLWDGVYLYPSRDLVTIGEPIRLCDQLGHVVLMIEPVDWDGDGREEAIGTDREGNISALRRVGEFPDLRLEVAQRPLMSDEGLPFNIPFVNPKYRLLDHPESVWPESFNYTYPTIYRPRGKKSADLIIGDWGGELWYMPQTSVKDDVPIFGGRTYAKRNGKQFARPRNLLTDEQGKTLLMGYGTENGIRYPGGASRPVMYRNENTQSDDLIVLCGMDGNEFRYLQRVKTGPEDEPVFQDLGEMLIEGLPDEGYDAYNYHGVLAVVGDEPWPDLLLARGCDLAVCKNERVAGPKPKFRFERWISGKNVPTRGYNFTEILTDHRGRRLLLENDSQWSFRELTVVDGQPRLSSERFPLFDQNGVFRVDGDTDAQHMTKWGFHRAALWDHDGSGRQHLIVGTDKGWLYLLRNEKPLGEHDRFEFRSIGPLTDTAGTIIRVHHRVVAAPLDLDADGDLDLVLAGATYAPNDPNPGSGIYYVLNKGQTPDQTPILSPVQPLETIGHVHPPFKHHHAQLQSLDLLGTGERLLVACTQLGDHFRGYVYRPARGKPAVEHTGLVTPPISIEERLLDLDGDGDWEYLRSGGESLIAKYSHVQIEKVAAGPKMSVLHHAVVNDTIPDAQTPTGLVKDPSDGSLVLAFQDKGDVVAGTVTHFVRSIDGGKSWSQPFASYQDADPKVGAGVGFVQLPTGRIIAVIMEVEHTDVSVEGFKAPRKSRTVIADFDPHTAKLTPVSKLPQPPDSLVGAMPTNFIKLSNGDLILPAYLIPMDLHKPSPGVVYGSGLFRSRDDGKTWGDFELVFGKHPQQPEIFYNESVIFEKPDGTLVAFARYDNETPPAKRFMGKVVSKDFGRTWSAPVDSDLPAICPALLRRTDASYLMFAGALDERVPRTNMLYYSADGERFTKLGQPYYSRTGGNPWNTATGGSQVLLPLGGDQYVVSFYAADKNLPGRDGTYVDSNVIEIK